MTEIWKDIKGYEGIYQISNTGKVISLDRIIYTKDNRQYFYKGGLKEYTEDKDGYLRVGLNKENKQKTVGVHRLVAEAFIPNPDNLPEVNHKDENKKNNCVDNLQWVEQIDNIQYGTRAQRMAQTQKNNPARSYKVLCVETGIEYPSMAEAGRQLGINKGNIANTIAGRQKMAGGYHWKKI